MTIPRELTFPRWEGDSKFLGAVGVGVGVGCGGPITCNTCNFPGRVPDLLTPPTSLWIHINSEIKRIGSSDRCSPNMRSFDKGFKLISVVVLTLFSGVKIQL